MKILPAAFYQRPDVLVIATELLGKLLITRFNGELTSGRIVEVEAYNGAADKASHAYGNRKTRRTEVMFGAGGTAYVFLCYGIHHLLNVVTNQAGEPHAVLIRGIEPVEGVNIMLQRMNKARLDHSVGRGPGNVAKALGINMKHNGVSLTTDELYIADDEFVVADAQVAASPRIGVDYAGEDARLLYRFHVKDNPFVSGKR